MPELEEEIPEDLKTSQGYMKDGFVVDDDGALLFVFSRLEDDSSDTSF